LEAHNISERLIQAESCRPARPGCPQEGTSMERSAHPCESPRSSATPERVWRPSLLASGPVRAGRPGAAAGGGGGGDGGGAGGSGARGERGGRRGQDRPVGGEEGAVVRLEAAVGERAQLGPVGEPD